MWHQRWLIGRVKGSSAIEPLILVATPDGDVYEECLEEASDDISCVRFSSTRWPCPVGVPRASCYRFDADLGPREQAAVGVQAVTIARDVGRQLRGDGARRRDDGEEFLLPLDADAPVVGVGPGYVCPADTAAAAELKDYEVWVSMETVGNVKRGDPVALDGCRRAWGSRCDS